MEISCCPERQPAEGQALQQVCRILAAAPKLVVTCLALVCRFPSEQHLGCTAIAQGLRPLASSLRRLVLSNIDLQMAADGVLASCLSNLLGLQLDGCLVNDVGVIALVGRWPSLRLVIFNRCQGVSDAGWLGLAGLRSDPLRIFCTPRCTAKLKAEFRAQQLLVLGAQHMDLS